MRVPFSPTNQTVFSPINQTVYRKDQYVTADGKTGKVIGWRSRGRGVRGKVLLVQLTGKIPGSGKVYAFEPRHVAPRKGNNGRGLLVRVA